MNAAISENDERTRTRAIWKNACEYNLHELDAIAARYIRDRLGLGATPAMVSYQLTWGVSLMASRLLFRAWRYSC